ncbi:MAG: trypsin-like peptidase domain-containing protein [Pseudomonadota bacterium]
MGTSRKHGPTGIVMRCLQAPLLAALVAASLAVTAPASAFSTEDGWYAYDAGDFPRAFRVWSALAAKGDAEAQYLVGYLYDDGLGVEHNLAEAARWYRMAAEQHHVYAQFNLAIMYSDGIGLPRDPVEAYRWFMLAADTPDLIDRRDALSAAEDVALGMTKVEIEQADRLIRAWRASKGLAESEDELYAPGAGEPWGDGTGFAVTGDGHVLTNHHVIDGCLRLEALVGKERVKSVDVLAVDPYADLALVKLDRTFDATAPFRDGPTLQLGEPVMVAGYPMRHVVSTSFTVTTGIISAMVGIDDYAGELQISAPVQPGNSGGPLLDRAGNVIGIVSAQLDEWYAVDAVNALPQNINFAIHGQVVQKFLGKHQVSFVRRTSDETLPSAAIADAARDFTLVIECYDTP